MKNRITSFGCYLSMQSGCKVVVSICLLIGVLMLLISILPQSIRTLGGSWHPHQFFPNATESPETSPVQSVYYLKVHKCASSTMESMFVRYALNHNLSVVLLTDTTHSYPDPDILQYFRPDPNVTKYSIWASHTTFEEEQIRQLLPGDAKFITILRHPFSLLKSVFNYYRLCNKFNITPCDRAVEIFLESPATYDHLALKSECCEDSLKKRSYIRNFIASHFGFRNVTDENMGVYQIEDWIKFIESRFHFIGFAEHFDESLVYIRRMLKWDLKDIMYLKLRNLKAKMKHRQAQEETKTNELDQKYRKWSSVDYQFYDYVYSRFKSRIAEAGQDLQDEVDYFKAFTVKVQDFCYQFCKPIHDAIKKKTLDSFLDVLDERRMPYSASKWHRAGSLSGRECVEMMLNPDLVKATAMSRGSQVCRMRCHLLRNIPVDALNGPWALLMCR